MSFSGVIRSRKGRVLAVVVAVVALGAGGVAWVSPGLSGSTYAQVESIEHRADYQDAATLEAAWQLPVAALYRAKTFEFQSNPSFCAPTSAANVLRSLGTDLTQQQVIHGTPFDPWFGMLLRGLTLDQLADLLRLRTNLPVTIVRARDLSAFRAELAHANDPRRRYIVNFHRGPLFGRGHGHFSPILGYLVSKDLVFVGDVNHDYQPFLVSSERLWAAVDTTDDDSEKKRGLLLVHAPGIPTSPAASVGNGAVSGRAAWLGDIVDVHYRISMQLLRLETSKEAAGLETDDVTHNCDPATSKPTYASVNETLTRLISQSPALDVDAESVSRLRRIQEEWTSLAEQQEFIWKFSEKQPEVALADRCLRSTDVVGGRAAIDGAFKDILKAALR